MNKAKAKILVVSKRTCYMEMVERNDVAGLALVAEKHESVSTVKETHDDHVAALACVQAELAGRGLEHTSMQRCSFKGCIPSGFDLVVTVGGDGSVIDVSHYLSGNVPVLGVNSAPRSSHGHFCLANAGNFDDVLEEILAGHLVPLPLVRLEMELNGEILPTRVLNEILVCDRDPASTCRLTLEVGGVKERQKSSGLLIGTPAGSTGFLRSAGGIIQPIADTSFQYLPREPFLNIGQKLALPGGLVASNQTLRVVSGMPDGVLCVDGKYIKYAFPRGAELVVRVSSEPVMAYVDENCHDRYMSKSVGTRVGGWLRRSVTGFLDLFR